METLLKAGANVNNPSEGNRTPLMGAAMFGHDDIVEILLERKADVSVKNDFKESALDLAKTKRTRKLLLRFGAE